MNELVSTLYWTTDTDFGGFSECTLLDQCTSSTFLRLREKKEDLSEVPDEHGQNKNHYCYKHPQNRSEAEGWKTLEPDYSAWYEHNKHDVVQWRLIGAELPRCTCRGHRAHGRCTSVTSLYPHMYVLRARPCRLKAIEEVLGCGCCLMTGLHVLILCGGQLSLYQLSVTCRRCEDCPRTPDFQLWLNTSHRRSQWRAGMFLVGTFGLLWWIYLTLSRTWYYSDGGGQNKSTIQENKIIFNLFSLNVKWKRKEKKKELKAQINTAKWSTVVWRWTTSSSSGPCLIRWVVR